MRNTTSNGFGSRLKRVRSITAFIALCGLVIGIPLAVYFARNSETAEAGWWDELWNHRKRFDFSNSGSDTTNKIVSFSVDTATLISEGKMRSSCQDVRFTNAVGFPIEHRINSGEGIVFETSSEYSDNTDTNSYSWSHSVNTDSSNQVLVVVVHFMDAVAGNATVSTVKYNNVDLTNRIEYTNSSASQDFVTSIWTLNSPATGSNTIQVNLSENISEIVASAMTYNGVDLTTPIGSTASNGSSSAHGLTITNTTTYDKSILVGGSFRQNSNAGFTGDYVRPVHLNSPGRETYAERTSNTSDTQVAIGGAGGFQYAHGIGSHSMTFDIEEDVNTYWNGAWIELKPYLPNGCNTASTDFEVLFPAIYAGDNSAFMYYSNPTANSNESSLADPSKPITHKESTEYESTATGDLYEFSHTVSSGEDQVLVVMLGGMTTVRSHIFADTVTFDGVNLVKGPFISDYTTNRNNTFEIWTLINPPTGQKTVSVTYDSPGAAQSIFIGAAMTYDFAAQNYNSTAGIAKASSATEVTISTTTISQMNLLVGGAYRRHATTNNDISMTSPGIRRHDDAVSTGTNNYINIAGGDQVANGAGSQSVIFTASGTGLSWLGTVIGIQPESDYDMFTPNSGPTSQAEEIGPGPVLYWKLDESSENACTGGVNDICDSTSNLNDGTYSATRASGSSCLLGGCYQFNGTTNAITLPTASDAFVDFAGSEAFSGSAWIYVTTMPTGTDKDAVIAKWDENSNHAAYRLYVENDDADSTGNMAVQIYDESASQVITATGTTDAIAQNTWYHVAFSFNGGTSGTAGDLKIYVNGSYQAQNILNGSFAGLENLASDFTVADYDTNDSTSGNTAFTGTIDEVKMFAYARSAEHMKNDYLIGSTASGSNVVLGGGLTPMPTPIVRWKFDEGSGAVANNSGSTGSGDNGSITSGAWSLSGKYDKALTFTASTSVTDTITDPGNTNTLSLWIYPTTSVDSKTLITAGKLATDASSRPTYGTCTGTSLALNEWTHIVAVSGGAGSCTLYQNGVATSTNTTGVTFGTSINVGGSSFTGSIDEVKVYDDALSADQVKVDFNADAAINLGSGVNERSALTDGDYQSTLVGYWPLDENTDNSCTGGTNDVCDRSGNSNNGANNASPIWVPGKFGSALYFTSGSSQYTSITGPSSVKTVSFWVNPQDNTEPMLNITSTTDYITSSSGTVTATGFDSPSIYVNGILNGTITGNYWNHVVVASDTAENASALYFGRANASYLTGSVDEVRLFSTKLTQAQVAYEFSRGAPVAWWRLDECAGYALNDAAEVYPLPTLRPNGTITIGGTGNFTSTGNCVSGTSTHAWYAGATGKIGSALGFDDTNDYATVADHAALDLTSSLSIAAWVKPAANEADNVIISKGTSYEMGLTADGDVYFYNGTSTLDDESAKATSGAWHHVVITNNDTTTTYYVDGISTGTDPLGIGADNATALYIGYDGTNYFDGLIDDVRIFNYPLSATQVKQVFAGGSVRFE